MFVVEIKQNISLATPAVEVVEVTDVLVVEELLLEEVAAAAAVVVVVELWLMFCSTEHL